MSQNGVPRLRAVKNQGRFLSLKGLDEGTNVAFLAVRDILAFQTRHSADLSPKGPAGKSLVRQCLKVSVLMLFNNTVHDLLAQPGRGCGRVRFRKQTNTFSGSRNCGHEYDQLVGQQKMDVQTPADISLAIRIAQQAKQSLSDRFQMELGDLTQRSCLVVRAEWCDGRTDPHPRIYDFVELPSTNMLSAKLKGSFCSLKQASYNRKAALEQYNLLQ